MLPEELADRLLQGQKAIHHLELADSPSRQVMFCKGKSRAGWGPAGAGGAEDGGVDFLYLICLCDGNRTRPKGHQT